MTDPTDEQLRRIAARNRPTFSVTGQRTKRLFPKWVSNYRVLVAIIVMVIIVTAGITWIFTQPGPETSTTPTGQVLPFRITPTSQYLVVFYNSPLSTSWAIMAGTGGQTGTLSLSIDPTGYNITVIPWHGTLARTLNNVQVIVTLGANPCYVHPNGNLPNCVGSAYFTLTPTWTPQ